MAAPGSRAPSQGVGRVFGLVGIFGRIAKSARQWARGEAGSERALTLPSVSGARGMWRSGAARQAPMLSGSGMTSAPPGGAVGGFDVFHRAGGLMAKGTVGKRARKIVENILKIVLHGVQGWGRMSPVGRLGGNEK